MAWTRILLRLGVLAANALLFGIAARAFGTEDMGIWSLASAMTSIVLSLDWGVANSVRNRMVARFDESEGLFWSGVWVALSLALCYAALGIVVWKCLPWMSGTGGLSVAAPYLLLALVLLALRIPCTVAMNAFFSFGEAHHYTWFEFLAMAVGVSASVLVIALGGGLGPALFAFYFSGTLLLVVALVQFTRRRQWRPWLPSRSMLAEVWLKSWPFGLLQIVALGLGSTPAFVIGSLIGIEDATGVRALVILGQAVMAMHLAHAMPLWTEFSQISGQPDRIAAVERLRRRMFREAALLGVVFVALGLGAPLFINFWVGREVTTLFQSIAFAMWGWAYGVCNLYSLVLNGRDRPLMTAAALVPGIICVFALSWLWVDPWRSNGIGAAFAVGACVSAGLMAAFAAAEIRGIVASRPRRANLT